MFLFRPEKIIMCPGSTLFSWLFNRLSRFLFWIRSASVSCLLLVIVLSPAGHHQALWQVMCLRVSVLKTGGASEDPVTPSLINISFTVQRIF